MLSRLLAATPWARRSPDGGDNFPDSRRLRFRVGKDMPPEPSTIAIYATDSGGVTRGQLLLGDFDVSRAATAGVPDPVAQVATEAAAFAVLVEECGGRVVHDTSPSGGRHVYVKFARALAFDDLRALALALADRFPTLDPAPMLSTGGQIRIAGSPYKRQPVEQPDGSFRRTGPLLGFMALTMPLAEAAAVLRRPCGPRVWERLQEALTAERVAVDPAPSLSTPVPGVWHLDGQGQPWAPLRGGRRPLPARLAELARTGAWEDPRLQPEDDRYDSPSEARYGVLRSAAAGGWSLTELTEQARPGGLFAGLDTLLGTRSAPQRRAVMAHDWQEAVRETAALRTLSSAGRNSHTSSATHPPQSSAHAGAWPVPRALTTTSLSSARCHQDLVRWQTAVWLAERDPVRCKGWGRGAVSARLVLRALALAARLSGSTTTAFGCRSLALMCGLSWRTVAAVLADLRDEADPLIDLVERGRELEADRYMLRMPDVYRAEATRTVLEAGRIETGHPVWLAEELGRVCALLYETLSALGARPVDLQRRAVLSSSAVSEALAALGAYGLAVRGADGWRRGDRSLDDVATELQAFDRYAERVAAYRAHRAEWRSFIESVRPLATALADMEAAFAERDRYVSEHELAPDLDQELAEALTAAVGEHITTPVSPHPQPEKTPVDRARPERASTWPQRFEQEYEHVHDRQPTQGRTSLAAVVPAPAPALDDVPHRPGETPSGDLPVAIEPTSVPPPVRTVITPHEVAHEDAARRGAARIRRVMAARGPEERERILAEDAAEGELASPDPAQ
ncbi:hypothetical protein ACLQ2P_41510 [Actinomadura citrea]|uniref:hypothetical protein n=1 Tax=Actinomadura citrea TaxID=46158 RepID=UPI003CE4C1D3